MFIIIYRALFHTYSFSKQNTGSNSDNNLLSSPSILLHLATFYDLTFVCFKDTFPLLYFLMHFLSPPPQKRENHSPPGIPSIKDIRESCGFSCKTYHPLFQQRQYRLWSLIILRQKTLRCVYQNLIRGISQNLISDIGIANLTLRTLCILKRIVRISCCML